MTDKSHYWYNNVKPIQRDASKQYNPGVGGLGFDWKGFRIVMYPPQPNGGLEFNSGEAARRNHKTEILLGSDDDMDDGMVFHDKIASRFRRRGEAANRKAPCKQGEIHGPAHVHVFDLRRKGSELRFELLEAVNGDQAARPLYINGGYPNPLTPQEIRLVQPILDQSASAFIQLWRELYPGKLGRYVTRVTPTKRGFIEEYCDTSGNHLSKVVREL